jgi:hypothetical protein
VKKGLLMVVSLASGCGVANQPSPSFSQAVPSRKTLDLSVPAVDAPTAQRASSAALSGQTADLYVLTRQTAANVNGAIGSVLETIGSIAGGPPTVVGATGARWGPWTDALSPVAWQLVVQQVESSAYAFQLQIRPKAGTDADFQPFLRGASEGVNADGPSQGTFSVDFGVAHELDPMGNAVEGQVVAAWSVQPDAREVNLHLAGVHVAADPPATADVAAVFFSDGSGALGLTANPDPLGSIGGLEVEHVVSRWNATGAGMAEAELQQADGGADIGVTECWDASFGLIYLRSEMADGGTTEGDAKGCAFADSGG